MLILPIPSHLLICSGYLNIDLDRCLVLTKCIHAGGGERVGRRLRSEEEKRQIGSRWTRLWHRRLHQVQ